MKAHKVGRAVYIRVSPKDCMAVVDVLRQIDLLPRGMSFAQAVSLALSSAFEGLRQAGIIPTRTGFEFTDMMVHFPPDRKIDRMRKLDVTNAISGAGDFTAPSIIPETAERKRKRLRYEELKFKRETDPVNMSEVEMEEFRPLVDEFLPT